MKTLHIQHAHGQYPVYIGSGLLSKQNLFNDIKLNNVLIVTDETVAPLYAATICNTLKTPADRVLALPAGESFKTIDSAQRIWDAAAALGLRRDDCMIALGGGVIGDVTGFAAATWMRGIRFIQMPTTLLAQVDASIGGKTGCNLPAGKNLIGAFHQPSAVVIDTDTLKTLAKREYRAGLAEVVKAGLISDSSLLQVLQQNIASILARDGQVLAGLIARSVEIKADIVQQDEREAGVRALLNLGHTFAHAIETAQGYGNWLHGEAVSVGLVLAAQLSELLCGFPPEETRKLQGLLHALGLPVALPSGLLPGALLEHMNLDKKTIRDGWRFIVLDQPGKARILTLTDLEPIKQVLTSA